MLGLHFIPDQAADLDDIALHVIVQYLQSLQEDATIYSLCEPAQELS